MITSALGMGCYITTINYDYRLVFLFPLISLIISNLLDGRTLRPENKQFLTMLAGASAYILILPFTRSLALSSGTYLELIDEMIVAPFLFSGLAAIWINLHQSPPEKPAFHQTAFPQQIGSCSP
ncbi:MAG: hypothetical protein VKM17_07910 [Cyanobacteriota bacterium]|nr:hypothetical protein [Cyanobacteriota bacterium]